MQRARLGWLIAAALALVLVAGVQASPDPARVFAGGGVIFTDRFHEFGERIRFFNRKQFFPLGGVGGGE